MVAFLDFINNTTIGFIEEQYQLPEKLQCVPHFGLMYL